MTEKKGFDKEERALTEKKEVGKRKTSRRERRKLGARTRARKRAREISMIHCGNRIFCTPHILFSPSKLPPRFCSTEQALCQGGPGTSVDDCGSGPAPAHGGPATRGYVSLRVNYWYTWVFNT